MSFEETFAVFFMVGRGGRSAGPFVVGRGGRSAGPFVVGRGSSGTAGPFVGRSGTAGPFVVVGRGRSGTAGAPGSRLPLGMAAEVGRLGMAR